jgi:tetratricopeptide (TPR) repeat protein
MAIEGESADLLTQRAIEYRVLGKLAEAAKDLERALRFEPEGLFAQGELSRVYFALGKTNEALRTVSRALKNPAEGPERAGLFVIRAEILRSRREYQKALKDVEAAIAEHAGQVEWYLLRSQLQARLKRHKERVVGLEEGIKETASGVLQAERIDALIDNGEYAEALAKIESEIKDSRWQSSWLIRRARVRIASGEKEGAEEDLKTAIAELNRRIVASTPDPQLLLDRGQAHQLLGEVEEALRDFERAVQKGITEEWARERVKALKEAKKIASEDDEE